MIYLPPVGLKARTLKWKRSHEVGRAANVQGGFTSGRLGCFFFFFPSNTLCEGVHLLNFPTDCQYLYPFSSFFFFFTRTSLEHSERREDWFHCTPPPLPILSPQSLSCKCALGVDWPEGWRSAGSRWVQEWAIHPSYLGGGGGAGRRSTCLLNKSSASPFCSCSPINQRGPGECS